MKISIVVPVFNCENFLGECIDSVINQSDDRWELILVNDGSTDNSAEILDSYAEKYPDKISVFHKENEGQFLTRKFGALRCTGDYISFLDADDILESDYVQTLTENIGKYPYPDSVCFGFVQFGNGETKETMISDSTTLFRSAEERRTVYNKIVDGSIAGSLWSKSFRKDLIVNNFPDETIVKNKRFAEDAYHSFDLLAKSESILFINKALYRYRNNEQGFSQGFESRSPDYFNSKYLYELIEGNLGIMGIDSPESRFALYERNFNETVYFMIRYLRASKNSIRKIEIIRFDWSTYLLEGTLEQLRNGANFNKAYLNIWYSFKEKKIPKILVKERFRRIAGW